MNKHFVILLNVLLRQHSADVPAVGELISRPGLLWRTTHLRQTGGNNISAEMIFCLAANSGKTSKAAHAVCKEVRESCDKPLEYAAFPAKPYN